MPPPPGASDDLPPGFVPARGAARGPRRRRTALAVAAAAIVGVGAVAVLVATSGDQGPGTVADVAVGECFNGGFNDARTIACTEPHRFEMIAIAPAPDPGAPFPGDGAVRTAGGDACVTALSAYYGAGPEVALADGLELDPVAPTEARWNEGETDTFCVARAAGDRLLTATIRGQGAP